MSDSPFRARTIVILAIVAGTSLLAYLLLMAFGPEIEGVSSADADAFSRSALGHRALVEILRDLDVPVIVSRHETARKLSESTVLILAEPPTEDESLDRYDSIRVMLDRAQRALIVLPKRSGRQGAWHSDWIDRQWLLETEAVDRVLAELRIDGETVRPETTRWIGNPFDVAPDVDEIQVIRNSRLRPIIATDAGILLGQVPHSGDRILVLSDPDLLATHGIGRGDNAYLAYRIVQSLRDGVRTVVLDETHHGHAIQRSLWSELFRFPLVLVMLELVAVLGVMLWASVGRFGAPVPAPPEFRPGKEALIQNTAELLRHGGHAPLMLKRYLQATRQDVTEALHAPTEMTASARTEWLDRVGQERGVTIDPASLVEEVRTACAANRWEAARITAAARRIHRWKTEILHGTARPRS